MWLSISGIVADRHTIVKIVPWYFIVNLKLSIMGIGLAKSASLE
jgi:hypothetical protein